MYKLYECMYDQFFVYELVLILSFRCCAIMKMSRQWMYADQRSVEFVNGLHSFLQVAEANKRDGFISCPCGVCKNNKATLTQKIFTSICLSMVSCLAITVGPSMEKEE